MPQTRLTLQTRLALSVVLTAAALSAHANTPQNMRRGEIARLPEYCADAQGMGTNGTPSAPTERQRHWVALMGRTFWHIHHYCWALLNVNRAADPSLSPQYRRHLFQWAINDCQYVFSNLEPGFPLLPEMFTKVGDFSVQTGNLVQAMEFYEQARASKSDYWPAHVGIAELHLRLGRRDAAIEVLNAGLSLVPDQPKLISLLQRAKATPPTRRERQPVQAAEASRRPVAAASAAR